VKEVRTVVTDADGILIRRCQAGDREAFAALVERYQRQVYGIAHRLTNDRQEAEDLAQEAFLRAYRALATFRPDQPFSPWIARIVTNLAFDHLRRRRREDVSASEDPPELCDGSPGPETVLVANDEQGRLMAAIERLTPEYRIPLLLHHVQGVPLEVVAQATNLPLTVVKNRLYRARKLLREQMRDQATETPSRGCERDERLSVRTSMGSVR
jgi:RNA polymerase sigma-70 factor (ECF subfamily)